MGRSPGQLDASSSLRVTPSLKIQALAMGFPFAPEAGNRTGANAYLRDRTRQGSEARKRGSRSIAAPPKGGVPKETPGTPDWMSLRAHRC
jgi:hypothetical protein